MNTTSIQLISDRLLVTGDWHIGNDNVEERGIENFLKRAKKHVWVHLGDILEAIMPADKRFSVAEHKTTMSECIRDAKAYLGESAATCAGLVVGNHELAATRLIGNFVEDLLCLRGSGASRVPYLGQVCFAEVWNKKRMSSTALLTHGSCSIGGRSGEPERIKANRQVKMRDVFRAFDAEICLMGHIHQFEVAPPAVEQKLTLQDGKVTLAQVRTRRGWYASCPSMFKVYGPKSGLNYAEPMLVRPSEIGWVEVVYDGQAQVSQVELYSSTGALVKTVEPDNTGR